MIEVKLTLQWHEQLREWRVTGSGDSYWGVASIDALPEAVRGMLRCEAQKIEEACEDK